MAFVNYNNKEITVKIVYYGPALSGKTTCLQYTYASKEYKKKGKLITLDTDGDRTLFFDFLPIEIGKLGDYSIKMQLYTVPGQVAYDTTRKLVLQGSDGIVFVADSQVVMREQNIASLQNLKDNLSANKISFSEIPLIFQYNKRDLKEILPLDVLNQDLNPDNKPFFPTIGTTGENILEGLHTIMKMVIIYLKNKLSIFHKDKTVMFSREEATDTIVAPRSRVKAPTPAPKAAKVERLDEKAMEDTEKEEVFELSGPVEEESLKTQDYPPEESDEDIFNLGDDNMLMSDSSDSVGSVSGPDLEIPDVNLQDELGEKPPEPKPEPVTLTPEMVKKEAASVQAVQAEVPVDQTGNSIDIPLTVHIPEDKDEIKINLDLRIVIRKR